MENITLNRLLSRDGPLSLLGKTRPISGLRQRKVLQMPLKTVQHSLNMIARANVKECFGVHAILTHFSSGLGFVHYAIIKWKYLRPRCLISDEALFVQNIHRHRSLSSFSCVSCLLGLSERFLHSFGPVFVVSTFRRVVTTRCLESVFCLCSFHVQRFYQQLMRNLGRSTTWMR